MSCRSETVAVPRVFAAASLQDALREVRSLYESHGAAFSLNFAGSNILARQIANARVGDLFFSADEAWMSWLEERGLVVPESRFTLLGNRLVIVARRDSKHTLRAAEGLAQSGFQRIFLGDPELVPAGRYARAALLEHRVAGQPLWSLVSSRVVPALDVRAALAGVASSPHHLGIVYATDARVDRRVNVLCELPLRGQQIRYPVATLRHARHPEKAARLSRFLAAPEALGVFERHGFIPLHRARPQGA